MQCVKSPTLSSTFSRALCAPGPLREVPPAGGSVGRGGRPVGADRLSRERVDVREESRRLKGVCVVSNV